VAAIKYGSIICNIKGIYMRILSVYFSPTLEMNLLNNTFFIRKTFNPNRNNVNGYVVFKDKESVGKALAR
jgi:hypothetical protein